MHLHNINTYDDKDGGDDIIITTAALFSHFFCRGKYVTQQRYLLDLQSTDPGFESHPLR